MSRLAATLVLLLALGLMASACGTASDCSSLCDTLVSDCAMGTWDSASTCANGCTDELFRHPDRTTVMECYEAAADSCDLDDLVDCKLLEFQTGNVAE